MIAVIQRVLEAKVDVAGATVGKIGPGMLALVAVEKVPEVHPPDEGYAVNRLAPHGGKRAISVVHGLTFE